MTRTYCTACACYKSRWGGGIAVVRTCKHPKGPGKLESPQTPDTCPLKIKHTLTPENSFAFVPYQIDGDPPINDVRVVQYE